MLRLRSRGTVDCSTLVYTTYDKKILVDLYQTATASPFIFRSITSVVLVTTRQTSRYRPWLIRRLQHPTSLSWYGSKSMLGEPLPFVSFLVRDIPYRRRDYFAHFSMELTPSFSFFSGGSDTIPQRDEMKCNKDTMERLGDDRYDQTWHTLSFICHNFLKIRNVAGLRLASSISAAWW